jgi:hypothetical protein
MAYQFTINFPNIGSDAHTLLSLQHQLITNRKDCNVLQYNSIATPQIHSTIYTAQKPSDIMSVASSLKNADPKYKITNIEKNGHTIYYSPSELKKMSPIQKQLYINTLNNLNPSERLLHDYLINIYKEIPT